MQGESGRSAAVTKHAVVVELSRCARLRGAELTLSAL
jgi:hypothetical protein